MTKGTKIALIALAGVGTAAAVYYLMNKSGGSTTANTPPPTGPLPYVKVVKPTGNTVVLPNPDLIKKGNYVPPPQSELLKNLIATMK